jgi:hypothetical protein
MHTEAQKRLVRIILDVECYEDLDLEDLNWSEMLGLEGDESVDASIIEISESF